MAAGRLPAAGPARALPPDRVLLAAGSSALERMPPRREGGSTGWHQPLHVRDRAASRRAVRAQVEAGADVVVAPAYLTHRRALSPYGETRRAAEWTRAAVEVAREAVEAAFDAAGSGDAPERRVLVAGPMSPLLPGRFEPALDPGVLAEEDRARADQLVESGVDLLLAEAMPSLAEARSAAVGAVATGVPVWLGLRLAPSGVHLPSGDALEAVWAEVAELPLDAVLVTPSSMAAAAEALASLRRFVDAPPGLWPAADGTIPEPDVSVAEQAGRWLDAGARVIGLASAATPDVLAELRAAIAERTAAAEERRKADHRAWLDAVADAGARAPGGRALWLGGSVPAELPRGFAWTLASTVELATLPERAFRLAVVVDPDPHDTTRPPDLTRFAMLLDQGGYLLIRSGDSPAQLPDGLELRRTVLAADGLATLLRRRS